MRMIYVQSNLTLAFIKGPVSYFLLRNEDSIKMRFYKQRINYKGFINLDFREIFVGVRNGRARSDCMY